MVTAGFHFRNTRVKINTSYSSDINGGKQSAGAEISVKSDSVARGSKVHGAIYRIIISQVSECGGKGNVSTKINCARVFLVTAGFHFRNTRAKINTSCSSDINGGKRTAGAEISVKKDYRGSSDVKLLAAAINIAHSNPSSSAKLNIRREVHGRSRGRGKC